jgi:HAD superfamily hydrolase (TIGR01509 family)
MKAAIFDFDGVVVDSEPWQFESLKKALKEFSYEMTKEQFIREWVEEGSDFNDAVKHYRLNTTPDEIRRIKKGYYFELVEKKMKLMPHAKEAIARIKKNFRTALATNSDRVDVEKILGRFGIKDIFDVIVSREDYRERKPSPECLFVAAGKLGVKPEECFVIEDSERGVKTAKNAGMKVIAFPNEFSKNSNFSQADLIVKSLNEITLKKIGEL